MIRAVTKTAIHEHHLEVFGIEDGYEGLILKRGHFLTSDNVSGILTHGGTILGTSNRADPFRVPFKKKGKIIFEDQSQHALRHIKDWGLSALVAVGGDGTLSIANKLAALGIHVVGIPKTIDNDLPGTDFTFGFDTAVDIATEAIDRLHTTAASHHRVMILEVMGRNAGWIALHSGVAGGADIILIPEIPFSLKSVYKTVEERALKGKRFSIIVAAEGAHEAGKSQVIRRRDKLNPYPVKLGGIGNFMAEAIEKATGREARAAVLGHIQRGGSPSAFDRNLGTAFGVHAVRILASSSKPMMVRYKNNRFSEVPLSEAVGHIRKVPKDHHFISSAKAVGVSFGE